MRGIDRSRAKAGWAMWAAALLTTTALGSIGWAVPAVAQSAEANQSFNIPAQPLPSALTQFGRQSGLQVSVPSALAQSKASSTVSGSMGALQALSRLLAGSGLTYRITGNIVTLEAAPAATAGVIQLAPVRVEGATNAAGSAPPLLGGNLRGPSDDPIAQRLNPQTTIGSKDPVSQREIPQSVTVITQDQIQAQNLLTVDDVIRITPGMTVIVSNPNDTAYSARGFPITAFQLDGVPTAIPGGGNGVAPDGLAMYDRVEILRGPAGLFNGFGGDGGVINLVRKRAPDSFELSGLLSGGTYDNLRGQLDVGGPLNTAGTVRIRAVGFEQYQHLMQDSTWQQDQQGYVTLEADLAPGLTARTGVSITDTAGRPMYGVPYASDNTLVHIPRSAYLGPNWNHFQNDRLSEFVEISQAFGDGWTAKVAYNHFSLDTHYLNGIASLIDNKATNLGELYDYKYDQHDEQHAVDLYVSGPFSLFGRVHRITVGANYLNDVTDGSESFLNSSSGYDVWGDVEANIFDRNAFAPPDFSGGPRNNDQIATQQYGLYGNLRLSLTDRLTLVGGARATWWRSQQTVPSDPNLNYFGESSSIDRLGPRVSPIGGLIYDLTKTISLYGSYASIFVPQTGSYTFSGSLIAPIEGAQYEAGIKGEYFGGRLNTSLALFQATETNNAVSDVLHPGFSLASGRVRSQGVEAQASGALAPGWTVLVGYTFDDSKRDKDNSSNNAAVGLTPKHLFKLSTDYQLPGAFSRWTIGGTAYAQTRTSFYCCGVSINAPGYATFDARIAYALTPKMLLMASVTNLLDRYYYSSVAGAINTLGDPRKVLFTLQMSY